MFFFIAISTWLGLNYYLGRRMISPLGVSRRAKKIIWSLQALFAIAPTIFITLGRNLDTPEKRELFTWIAFGSMGYISMLVGFVFIRDIGLGAVYITKKLTRRGNKPDETEPDPKRRAFLQNAVSAGMAGGTGVLWAVGAVEARKQPKVLEVDVPVKGLPKGLDGFSIAQLTDLHIGPTIHEKKLRSFVESVNGLEADMVAITGDLLDGFVETIGSEMGPLAELKSKHGTYFVTGNHEYYWNAPEWIEFLKGKGLKVLLNENDTIEHQGEQLSVCGVTDRREGKRVPGQESDPEKAIEGCPENAFKLLLAHQPRSVYSASKYGYDLQISGHTHGGQYFPFTWLIHVVQPYVEGLYRIENKMWLYVSRGTGYWGPPVRVGAPAEITLLTLRTA